MMILALVKIALVAVTDKSQISDTQQRSCPYFVHVAIQFGVPGWEARNDSETIFNPWLPDCLRTSLSSLPG